MMQCRVLRPAAKLLLGAVAQAGANARFELAPGSGHDCKRWLWPEAGTPSPLPSEE